MFSNFTIYNGILYSLSENVKEKSSWFPEKSELSCNFFVRCQTSKVTAGLYEKKQGIRKALFFPGITKVSY